MTRTVVLYTSQFGHTERVAEFIAETIRRQGLTCDLTPAAAVPEDFGGYAAAVVVGSAHSGRHSDELAALVRRHLGALREMVSAFCSVSLEAAEVAHADTPDKRAEAEREVHHAISHFLGTTHWQPQLVEPVAGALPYAHVGAFRRLLLKQHATATGLPTDTSHDHVFTDWPRLEGFVLAFCRRARAMDAAPEVEADDDALADAG